MTARDPAERPSARESWSPVPDRSSSRSPAGTKRRPFDSRRDHQPDVIDTIPNETLHRVTAMAARSVRSTDRGGQHQRRRPYVAGSHYGDEVEQIVRQIDLSGPARTPRGAADRRRRSRSSGHARLAPRAAPDRDPFLRGSPPQGQTAARWGPSRSPTSTGHRLDRPVAQPSRPRGARGGAAGTRPDGCRHQRVGCDRHRSSAFQRISRIGPSCDFRLDIRIRRPHELLENREVQIAQLLEIHAVPGRVPAQRARRSA